MIDNENILDDVSGAALWCGADCDPTDLARYASVALEHNVAAISVAPMSVGVVWPWLENKKIPIFARFYPRARGAAGASETVASINQAFKQGADGAQVFVSLQNLDEFVSQLYLIRDDLFFNKAAFVGVDICEIGPFDWNSVFSALRKCVQPAWYVHWHVMMAMRPILSDGFMLPWLRGMRRAIWIYTL